MPLSQYQLMALDSLQHKGPYGKEPWKEKSLQFYFKDRFPKSFQDPHNGYTVNSLVEGYYSQNAEKDFLSFYTNLNRGFLYQFGIIQVYIAEKDRHPQTPAQPWQESYPYPEEVKKIQDPARLSVVEKIKNWASGLDKEETWHTKKEIFLKICQHEQEAEEKHKLLLIRFSNGITENNRTTEKIKIDSTDQGQKNYGKSLFFGGSFFSIRHSSGLWGRSLVLHTS